MSKWKKIIEIIQTILGTVKLAFQANPLSFSFLLILELIQSLLPLATAWLTKLLFDYISVAPKISGTNGVSSELIWLLAGYTCLAILSATLAPLNSYLTNELNRSITLHTQLLVYRKLSSLKGISYFENPHFQDTIQLAAQGAQVGAIQTLNIFVSLVSSLVTLLTFLGVLLSLNIIMTVMLFCAIIPQLYLQLKLGKQRYELAIENSPKQRQANYYGVVLAGAYFAKEVRLFGLANHFLQLFNKTAGEVNASQRNLQKQELSWQLKLASLASLIASIAFAIISLELFAGKLTFGDVMLYLGALGSIQGALFGIILAVSEIHESLLFRSKFKTLLELPQPIKIPSPEERCPVAPLQYGIELRNVSFRYYEKQPWVLQNINLFIPAGKCLALVGLNGAGKTTLVKLLTRLYDPQEGQILWDNVDIRKFDPDEFRQQLGTILQDFIRYDLTAGENIGLGDVSQLNNQECIQQAAKQADINVTIEQLPEGYATVISRNLIGDNPDSSGLDLSGGQWQKVALARLFMRQKASFLILDEPTAALDAQAEYEIFNQFSQLIAGHTSFLISHRFNTVRQADLIAVLKDGQIVESGSHQELLVKDGNYARLYHLQAKQYTRELAG